MIDPLRIGVKHVAHALARHELTRTPCSLLVLHCEPEWTRENIQRKESGDKRWRNWNIEKRKIPKLHQLFNGNSSCCSISS